MKPFTRKSTPVATVSPTIKDIYWAAGYLEGEACFFWHKRTHSQQITVASTDEGPIARLQELFGGSIVYKVKKTPNHKPQWHWNAHGQRARGIMMTLYPLLSIRRQEKIQECLSN